MLDKQGWMYLLINTIVTLFVMILIFKYYESKIESLVRKVNKKNKISTHKINTTKNINNIDTVQEEKTEIEEDRRINVSDIDSFIDPLE
jgi:hypothetical protein